MTSRKLQLCGGAALAICAASAAMSPAALADETCMSPYMAKIVGQEDFVYVWTLGAEGVGDGQDKLVTIDVNPKSTSYGKVVHTLSVGGRNEAHHSGFTDDRRYLWAGGLDTSKLFVFDVHTDPAKPRLHKVVEDFVASSGGVVGPHTTYALPGRMMIKAPPKPIITPAQRRGPTCSPSKGMESAVTISGPTSMIALALASGSRDSALKNNMVVATRQAPRPSCSQMRWLCR